MQMDINTRHFTLGEDQRENVEEILGKVERFCPRPVQSFKLTLVHEAGHFVADGVLHLKSHDFRAEAEGAEPEIAVNELVERLKPQLTKYKGKISGKQKGEDGGLGKAMVDDGGVFATETSAPEGFLLRDMDINGAKEAFADADLPFLVFRNVENSRVGVIYRRNDGELGHMEARNEAQEG